MKESDWISLFEKAASKRESLKEITNAYRLFNGVGDGIKGISLDKFGDLFQLQFFSDDFNSEYKIICNAVQKIFIPKFLVAKWRTEKSGASLEHPNIEIVVGTLSESKGVVFEGNAKFYVDLLDTINPGLFLDMRDVRLEIGRRINTGRFLNLFSYTCSFSVHARLGGASLAVNADISGKILAKGRENFILNHLEIRSGEFFRGDALEYVKWAQKKGLKFDGIVLDPPSFARYKGRCFNVKKDLFSLVKECASILNSGGFFMVSSNYSGFLLNEFSKNVKKAIQIVHPTGRILWSKGQGIDFSGTGMSKESSLVAVLVEV